MELTRKTMCLLVLIAASILGCSTGQVYQSSENIDSALPHAININTASVEELEELPHIGRKTAEAIVQFRSENGPFRRVESLMQIRGVSEKRFIEMRHLLKTE